MEFGLRKLRSMSNVMGLFAFFVTGLLVLPSSVAAKELTAKQIADKAMAAGLFSFKEGQAVLEMKSPKLPAGSATTPCH